MGEGKERTGARKRRPGICETDMGRKKRRKDVARNGAGQARPRRSFPVVVFIPGFVIGVSAAVVVLSGLSSSSRRGPGETALPGAAVPPLVAEELRPAEEAFAAGRAMEAVGLFDAVYRRHPDRPEPLIGLVRVFIASKRFSDALEASKEAVRLAPENAACHLARGQALEAAGAAEEAEKSYARAAELAPEDPAPPYRLGRLAEARSHDEVAIQYYRQALAADPLYEPAIHHLAGQLMDAGAFDEAERLLVAALERVPGQTSLRLNLAHTFLRRGNAERAVEEFRTALRSVPEMPEPHYHLGCALVLLKRDQEAAESFRQALAHDPHLHRAWYALAQLYKRQGDEARAAEAFEEFARARALQTRIHDLEGRVTKRPKDGALLVELGAALLQRGRPIEALDALRRALSLAPDNERAKALHQRAREEIQRRWGDRPKG